MERTIDVACEALANREGSECEETVKPGHARRLRQERRLQAA
jgi:hypothetical protein